MSDYIFIVWLDQLGCDPLSVEVIAYEGNAENTERKLPPVGVGDFVVIKDEIQDREWLGQVQTPQLNLPLLGLDRTNPSNLAALERVLSGQVSTTVFTRQVYYYQILLLGAIENNTMQSVRVRPRGGSKGRIAKVEEVIRYLDMPAIFPTDAINLAEVLDASKHE